MSVTRNGDNAKTPPWGKDAALATGSEKPGARIYRSKSDRAEITSFFFNCKTRKDDPWYWENRLKPGYVRGILRQLTLSSGLLSFKETKLSVKASKDLSTSLYTLPALTDKSPGQDVVAPSPGVTTGRVAILTQSEWKYWQRRIRRDREEVWGIDTVYTIPQLDGTMAVVTVACYTLIPGRNYEGEPAIEKAILSLLSTHDKSKRIRGNWGSQNTKDRTSDTDREWTESSLLSYEEFSEEIRKLKKEGKLVHFSEREFRGNVRHALRAAEGCEPEVLKRLCIVPRAKKKSS